MSSHKPIGEILRGLDISELPEGWIPVEAVCIVKCLNTDGKPLWSLRMTDGLNQEELLGTMVIHTELLKNDAIEDWADD